MILALLLATLPPLSLPATRTQLPNGLTVIVSPDHSVPGVAVDLWYHVGSKDEDPGRTGFAHLFEHLMFMGARHAPYPKFDTIMESHGGSNNATTGPDTTHYFEAGPSNLLETFLWLEADRMATLGREMTAEKLETQRKIVLNERRQSYENRPYGLAGLEVYNRLFPKGHPYSWPVIGSAQDLEAAELSDVKRFFARWYVPSNASLVIVGDVDPAQVLKLVEKYFAWIPSPATKLTHATAPEVKLEKEQRVRMTDKVELPKLILAWTSPAGYKPGDADCDLLAQILAQGKASRLYEKLVHQKELATEVSAGQSSQELQGVFRIEAVARPGHTTQELLAAIDEELNALLDKGPTAAEVDASRTLIYTNTARLLEGLISRAELLNTYQVHLGYPTALNKDLARYEAATPRSVKEWGQRVLRAPRVVIEVQPEAKTAPATEKGTK
ncbi:MAG TPA: pitrilysin family protein [Myxococcaceae bacterium]|nr:pitrilysin family protein [Myxococcaceae bacterium]